MLARAEAFRRIQVGLREWTHLKPEDTRFVLDELLEHRESEVVTAARNVKTLDADEDWRDLLDPARTWLNATLHFDSQQRPVISLRVGPPRPADEVDREADVPIAVSMEPKPLRLVE